MTPDSSTGARLRALIEQPFRCLTCDTEVATVGEHCQRCANAIKDERKRARQVEEAAAEWAAYDRRTRPWWYDENGRHIGSRGYSAY